jgi:uncharacterized protein YggE
MTHPSPRTSSPRPTYPGRRGGRVGLSVAASGLRSPSVDEGRGSTNTIVVVGHGSATVTSDAAVLQVGLETRAEGAGTALSALSERSEAVLAAVRAQGIPDPDIQTLGLSLWPRMDNQGSRVLAYMASYSLLLRLRDLTAASAVIDAVSAAAGDALRLGGFRVSPSDTAAARSDAAARAVEDARGRAERLAQAAGVRLGRVVSMIEGAMSMPAPGPRVVRAAAAAVDRAAVPVEGGSAEVAASVTVTFEITD